MLISPLGGYLVLDTCIMKGDNKKKVTNRMNRLIGHAKSNAKMIEDDAYCIDVINQNLAVISALHKANEAILDNHLHTCVITAMRSNKKSEQDRVIKEIMTVYKKTK